MSELEKVANKISSPEVKLFNNIYSHGEIKFYDDGYEELDFTISALIGSTVQVFTVHIKPEQVENKIVKSYFVQVAYFDTMRSVAVVENKWLLDFLLHAEIIIDSKKHLLSLGYTPND